MMVDIQKSNYGNVTIIEIRHLSKEIKEKIREKLVEMCHGEKYSESDLQIFSLEKTIKSLSKWLEGKHKNQLVGIVGEILLNIFIREFTDIKIISPFFNMEERSFKKGFDILGTDKSKRLWIIESKAGVRNENKTPTELVREKIKDAQRDLEERLNSENLTLWENAVKSVDSYLKDRNEKVFIVDIIDKKLSISNKSNDKNVILGGIVFSTFDFVIDHSNIKELYEKISNLKTFSEVKIIAIQKETFMAVVDYISSLHTEQNGR